MGERDVRGRVELARGHVEQPVGQVRLLRRVGVVARVGGLVRRVGVEELVQRELEARDATDLGLALVVEADRSKS